MLDKYNYTYDSRRFSAHWIRGKFPPPRRPPFSARFLCREKTPQPRVHRLWRRGSTRFGRHAFRAWHRRRNFREIAALSGFWRLIFVTRAQRFLMFFFPGRCSPTSYVSPGRDGCFARASLWGLRAGIRSTTGITAPARNMPLYFCCHDHGSFFCVLFCFGRQQEA